MEVIHIYGSRDVLILFCDQLHTKSASREEDMSIYKPKSTQKKQKRLYGKKISILYKMEEIFLQIPNLYIARDNFLLECDHQDTESESCEI